MQKRLFVALKIEPNNTFITLYNNLKDLWQEHTIKWVPLNNIHLTLHFFGETDESLIPLISEQLKEAVHNISTFEINISNFGIFGSSYKPRVIWMNINPNENIKVLSQNISNNLSKIGYTADRQNFVPHLTIGRIKSIKDKQLFQKQLDEVKCKFIQQTSLHKMYLFESILGSKGASYHIIETFNFKDHEPKSLL